MHYSIKDITSSLPKKKNKGDSFWVQYLIRYVSYPFTYFFINLGWSANQVSILSWIVIFIGSLLLAINNNACMLAGVILINFWIVLDCVDGNIARTKKVKTFMGDFFDAIAGYGPFSFTTLALGVAAYNTTHLVNDEYRYLLLIVGGFGALINLYTRLIHQKYTNCFFAAKKILNELDDIVHFVNPNQQKIPLNMAFHTTFVPAVEFMGEIFRWNRFPFLQQKENFPKQCDFFNVILDTFKVFFVLSGWLQFFHSVALKSSNKSSTLS